MTYKSYSNRNSLRLFIMATAAALLMADAATAKPRTERQMRLAAASMLLRQSMAPGAAATESSVKEIARSDGYVIYGRDGSGFAVIATDDVAPEVLGYSDTKISNSITNYNFKWWLNAVDEVVKQAAQTNTAIKRVTKPDGSRFAAEVSPLCTSTWGQDEPYNNFLPSGTGGRCVTGCVATSMSQVLYFHKGPEHGIGTRTIYYPANNENGTPITADFESDIYDWDNMLDSYTAGNYSPKEGDAVALIMKDCGVATNMDYSPDGSGAYHDQCADGLRKYFGAADAEYIERRKYSEQEWMEIVYDQISRNLPIIYGGDDFSGGHSFVLDGYDADGRVHINWGWEGSEDGFYDIALLNPSNYSFSRNQDAVINIEPEPAIQLLSDTVKVTEPGTLRSLINQASILNYKLLKVEGKINSTDLKTIRFMANKDEFGENTGGHLKELDLTGASLVAGGDAYLNDAGTPLKIENENTLPAKVFYECSLKTLLLPDGIKSIGVGALVGTASLDSVMLKPAADADFILKDNIIYSADGKTIIASLPRISKTQEITGEVTAIGDYAFASRTRLTSLTLGSKISSIGRESFANCLSLNTIKVASKEPITINGAGAFKGIDKQRCTLMVRAGSLTKFKSASQWGDFKIIKEYGTTIKARNTKRIYGDPNPTMGYTKSGDYVDGVPEVYCDATPTSPVGRYPIHIKPGTITEEAVDYEEGFMIIAKAPLQVSVEDATRNKGEENPVFLLTYDGFKNDETKDVLTELPVATCVADVSSPVGTYPIIISGGKAENYALQYNQGTLTVTETSAIDAINEDVASGWFKIYSVSGELISGGTSTISDLPKGVYIIERTGSSKKSIHKVVVR